MHGSTLYECYKKPSPTKVAKWERIQADIKARHGFDVNVTANTWSFSVYYKYIDNSNTEHFVTITKNGEEDCKKYVTAIYINGEFFHNSMYYFTDDAIYNRRMTRLYNKLKKSYNDVTLVTYVKE